MPGRRLFPTSLCVSAVKWFPRLSQNFSRCQIVQQCQVGFEEIELGEFAALNPADLAEDAVFDFAFVTAHVEEAQLHRPSPGILMDDACHFATDDRLDS